MTGAMETVIVTVNGPPDSKRRDVRVQLNQQVTQVVGAGERQGNDGRIPDVGGDECRRRSDPRLGEQQ